MELPPVRAVLFDMDGVLVDSFPAWYALIRAAVDHFGGLPVTEAEYRTAFGQSSEDDCARWLPGTSAKALDELFVARFPAVASQVAAARGAHATLSLLRDAGIRRACVTNSPTAIATAILAGAELEDLLEVVIGADQVARPKPAPDMVLEALRRLEVGADEAVLVGDSRFDLEAAAAAGVRALHLRPSIEDRSAPGVIASLEEIRERIAEGR